MVTGSRRRGARSGAVALAVAWAALFASAAKSARAELGPNDISVVYPAPITVDGLRPLLRLDRDGALLDADGLDRFAAATGWMRGRPHDGLGSDVIALGDLYVTAFRFDPCFDIDAHARCASVLRVIAQPIKVLARESAPDFPVLVDAALHLFYAMSREESREALAGLAAIAADGRVPRTTPLTVHPGLAAEGQDGPLHAAMRRWLVEHGQKERLFKIAFMASGVPASESAQTWDFGETRVEAGGRRIHPLGLATVARPATFADAPTQQRVLVRETDVARQAQIELSPASAIADDPSFLFAPPNILDPATPRAPFETALRRLARITDAKALRAGDVDCGSCHVAQALEERLDLVGIHVPDGAPGERRRSARSAPADYRRDVIASAIGPAWNVVNFGFVTKLAPGAVIPANATSNIAASISTRVASETDAALAFLRHSPR